MSSVAERLVCVCVCDIIDEAETWRALAALMRRWRVMVFRNGIEGGVW